MQTKILRRGCAILAIAALCTLFPASHLEASISEAGITAPVNREASWSFLDFLNRIWARVVGVESQTGAMVEPSGDG